jgi:hypothetical protein
MISEAVGWKAPYRLVSLWDMFELPIGRLVASFQQVTSASQVLLGAGDGGGVVASEAVLTSIRDALIDLGECCEQMGLPVTKNLTGNVIKCLSVGKKEAPALQRFDRDQVRELDATFQALAQVILHESQTKVAMVLSPEMAKLYSPENPHFGSVVRDKFSRAIPEIDEAAKCRALGRPTASVFHLMRAVELVLKSAHACLGLTSPKSLNWTDWLTPIREERLRRGGTKWAENNFFQEVWQRLDSIKDSQRNSTMHVESIYTEEEARIIFENTRLFMQKVADRMDQDGEPKA